MFHVHTSQRPPSHVQRPFGKNPVHADGVSEHLDETEQQSQGTLHGRPERNQGPIADGILPRDIPSVDCDVCR